MLPQDLKKCQKCCNQWEKRKTSQTNYRYLASTNYLYFDHLSVFCCKIEIAQKINSFLLLSVTLTSYMVVEFKKGNKFYCVQAAKIIKSKVVVEDQFCWRWPPILVHFSNTTFLMINSLKGNQSTNKLIIDSYLWCFARFGTTFVQCITFNTTNSFVIMDFVLALFRLCWFWIYLARKLLLSN